MQADDHESKGLFVIVLLATILDNIIQEIIIVSNGSREPSATAAVVVFVLVAILFFGSLVIVHFVYMCILKHHYSCFITSFIQTIGAILYYYGNNITGLIYTYNQALGCDKECVINNRIAAVFSLGMALIIFKLVPPIVGKFKKESSKKKIPDWFSALDMITVMVKVDALYSTVVVSVNTEEFCGRADVATATAFISLSVIVGVAAEVAYWVYALTTDKTKNTLFTCLTTVGLFAFILCFPLYILADNHQPLDCAFGCDSFAVNLTMIEHSLSCNRSLNSGVRLGFNTITFIVVTTFSIIYFVCNTRARKQPEATDNGEDTNNIIELQTVV